MVGAVPPSPPRDGTFYDAGTENSKNVLQRPSCLVGAMGP